jgi:hypothetical protein
MGYELPSVPHRPHYSYSSNSNPRLLTLTLQAATGTHPPQPPTSHKRGDIGDLTLKDTPLQRLHYISMYISRLRLRLHRALKIQNSPLSPLLPGPLFREFKVSARDVVPLSTVDWCRSEHGSEHRHLEPGRAQSSGKGTKKITRKTRRVKALYWWCLIFVRDVGSVSVRQTVSLF